MSGQFHVIAPGTDRCKAHLLGVGQPGFIQISKRQVLNTLSAKAHGQHQSHRPGAEDQRVLLVACTRRFKPVQHAAHRFGKRGNLERHVADLVHRIGAHRRALGKSAVPGDTVGFQPVAEMGPSAFAGRASAAFDVGVDHDAIAD